MADVFTKKKRSAIMARIRGKGTSPERLVAKLLKAMGYKIQRHRKNLPGSPDIVLPLQKTALFLNGCFWHAHVGCARAKLPTSNVAFWTQKITGNAARDKRQYRLLKKAGWKVIVLWTCQKTDAIRLAGRLKRSGVPAPV
ncbi:MAG: hypothetical protein A2992_06280 [Elusimicrobia bacterium RIFCSPLOWO2_01_FULL_59_12]|nr:MAG: hypothetical protein A2992_06280 [Elusimicrobia bacterium RIFCSPLOWO2_01_FULL_59_12]